MPLETHDAHLLRAAEGYAELGLWSDANAELEKIDSDFRHVPEAVAMRLRIYRALEKWHLVQLVARKLALYDPNDADATIEWAYAARRADSIEAARQILSEAVERLPCLALLQYELARCECQLGEVEQAKERLHVVFDLDPRLRLRALNEPDLVPLW
jgi:tetratricopeptide (TPR) repeat protein